MEKIKKNLSRYITPKSLGIFLTVVYLISLIPLLVIAYYNYPSADDYSIGSEAHVAFMSTHSFFKAVVVAAMRSAEDWLNWMGYFTSEFLMAIPPSTFGERVYVLTTYFILLILSLSTVYFINALCTKLLKADKYLSLCVSMLILIATVQCMPEGMARVEAFYWYCGVANYILIHSFSLFYYGLIISILSDSGKKRTADIVLASFLGFFTGGGNQVSALNVAIMLAAAIALLVYNKKKESVKRIIVPVIFFFIGFILNVSAPGNRVRADISHGMNPIKAIFVSFYYCFDYCINEWTTWTVIVLLLISIPVFYKMAQKISFDFKYPVPVVVFGYCVASAMMTPPLFAVGSIEAGRLKALTYMMYILILFLCTGYVTGWVQKRFDKAGEGFSLNQIYYMGILILFLFFGVCLSVIPEPHCYTFSSAITDIKNGSAKAYGDALYERMELYNNTESGVVEVKPLPAQPELLYFSDIKEDSEDWENRGLCRYYDIKSVRVVKK